ncbi:hypothetical protein [Psychromarinibacter halotolerans]|uniref:Uncharacterized protein n=1 Tax=Psychromarinibacter halotolerans TaxID=1775175 RepID=A0ABV7GYK9_9RHOB|nr:hypothetical protein [Psychromarinibacter halotolerans]MDF0598446.1 hypothetical protein [Psychromarinibacter halotolerans]
MARLLVIAREGSRKGEVVAIKPDGHVWGKKEGLPDFGRVDLFGVPVGNLSDLLETAKDAEGEDVGRRAVLLRNPMPRLTTERSLRGDLRAYDEHL